MKNKNKGFTLVEMIIVISIFAILLGIIVRTYYRLSCGTRLLVVLLLGCRSSQGSITSEVFEREHAARCLSNV